MQIHKNRAILLREFKEASFEALENILSLNEWFKDGQPENIWVAGVYGFKNNIGCLVSTDHTIFLENFTQTLKVSLLNNKFSTQSISSLIPGDKVALKLIKGNISELLLLAVNLNQNNRSVFDDQQKWLMEKKWLQFLKKVEQYFVDRNFYQAKTPNLVICPGLEPSLNPFQVNFKFGQQKKKFFLPTSPELHLKKILAEGVSELFEITPCFRDEEIGFQHQPEFTMLEWYRSYKNLDVIAEDVQSLINFLNPSKANLIFKKLSIKKLFKIHLDFNLEPDTTQRELFDLACKYELRVDSSDSWDDIFFMLFISKIENHLGFDSVDFVFDYPPSQAALAKINSRGWADRFEVYWGGFELGNAFNELTCPDTQLKRFKKEQDERSRLHKSEIPIDEEFIEALSYGLAPTAGIAVGLDRLFMASNAIQNINKIKHFPFKLES